MIAVRMCSCRHINETRHEQGLRVKRDLWESRIHVGKKQAFLGSFASKQEAGVVWDAASVWRSLKAPGKHMLAAVYFCFWLALAACMGVSRCCRTQPLNAWSLLRLAASSCRLCQPHKPHL
jgi:hypothetical protein